MTRALFLDFDGTIADSLGVLYNLYNAFLKHYGKEGSLEEFAELNGPAMPEVLQILKKRHGINGSASELFGSYQKKLLEVYGTKVDPFEGTRPFLEEIVSRKIRCYIVTSAAKPLVDAFLSRHTYNSLIEAVITPEGLPKSKPDPAIYLRALAKGGICPTEVLAVEDSPNGILAATRAGIPTVAIAHRGECPPSTSGVVCEATSWDDVMARC